MEESGNSRVVDGKGREPSRPLSASQLLSGTERVAVMESKLDKLVGPLAYNLPPSVDNVAVDRCPDTFFMDTKVQSKNATIAGPTCRW